MIKNELVKILNNGVRYESSEKELSKDNLFMLNSNRFKEHEHDEDKTPLETSIIDNELLIDDDESNIDLNY